MTMGLPARAWADVRSCRRQVLGLHLVAQLAGVALFTPMIGAVSQAIVASTGDALVSNYDIAAFALSVRGVLFLLAVAAIGIALLLAEFTGLSWLAGHAIARRPTGLAGTVTQVASRLPALLALSTRVFLRLVLFLLPVLGVAAACWFGVLGAHDINYYLTENPPEFRHVKLVVGLLLLCVVLAALWQLARWLYAVPVLLHERCAPRVALARSTELTRGRLGRIVPPLAAWWLLSTAVALLLALLGREFAGLCLQWAGTSLQRVLPLVGTFLVASVVGGFLVGAIQLAGHQFLVTRLYAEQVDRSWRAPVVDAASPAMVGATRLVGVALVVLLLASALVFIDLVRRFDVMAEVAVTAHRGASHAAPENSMAAFRAAIDAGADYIELDVQRTRDGALLVMHDGDFLRMAGDPRKVRDVTAAEAARIDIGSRTDRRWAGEHPPLLSDVITLVRGRTRLNVELKYNVADPALAPAVVDLLRRERFLDQAVITSLDYRALKQVKRIEPRLRTGHIITAAVGHVERTQADFVSLNSARATPQLLRRAHAAGKQVHVWTVDRSEVMQRMIERGVDNLITNEPALAKQLMRERDALSPPERLALRLRALFTDAPVELVAPAAVPEQ